MKNIYIKFLFLLLCQISFAQVGVNTSTPQSDLHVDGSLQVTKEIRVSTDNSVKGNAGLKGEVLISNGVGQNPTWEKLEDVIIMPIINTIAIYDMTGPLVIDKESALIFNTVPYINSENLKYNSSTGEFTFLKSGYYRLYATAGSNSDGNITAGQVRTSLVKNGQIIMAKSSYHHEVSRFITHSIAGLEYFNANDKLLLKYYRKSPHNLTSAYISIIKTGN